jgi:hypothetical protein
MGVQGAADSVRRRIGASIIERVAGSAGPERRQAINQAGGERWFAETALVRPRGPCGHSRDPLGPHPTALGPGRVTLCRGVMTPW